MEQLMSEFSVLPEPRLEFAHDQLLEHPRDGLTLFGPYDALPNAGLRQFTYAVFGTPTGRDLFRRFSAAMQSPLLTPADFKEELWSHFPGFEAAYQANWPSEAAWEGEIDQEALDRATSHLDSHERVFGVTNLYLNSMRAVGKRDDTFNVFVCVVPDTVYERCRMQSKLAHGIGARVGARQKRARSVMNDFFDSYDPAQYSYSVDFRRQLKARVMDLKVPVPVQIIRESTLRMIDSDLNSRDLTPLSDRAWNLATALYYKCGGKPWRLSSARDGVCYVGIAFKDTEDRGRNACCAAQMFLDDGDGVVFMGDEGAWFTQRRGEYHLSDTAAKRLLEGTLATYSELHGKPLKEVFLHCRSSISELEFSGYAAACSAGVKLVAVRVAPERSGLRVYRPGTRPVFRGSLWRVTDRRAFLWGSGFKPRLRTYDGAEVPIPLCLEIQHGDADIEQVAKDILGLSKLNYNCAKLGENQPVTVHFSSAVGEILVTNRTGKTLPNFKYYI
jgi:hypothetical protein